MRKLLLLVALLWVAMPAFGQSRFPPFIPQDCTHAQLHAGQCPVQVQEGQIANVVDGNAVETDACTAGATTGVDKVTCQYLEGGWHEVIINATLGVPGTGETNNGLNLGSGHANVSGPNLGVEIPHNTFNTGDFTLISNLLSIDTTKWAELVDITAHAGDTSAHHTQFAPNISPSVDHANFDAETDARISIHGSNPNAHHIPTVDTNTNSTTECVGQEALLADSSCATIPVALGEANRLGDEGAGTLSLQGSTQPPASGVVLNLVRPFADDFDVVANVLSIDDLRWASQSEFDAHTTSNPNAHHIPTVNTDASTKCTGLESLRGQRYVRRAYGRR